MSDNSVILQLQDLVKTYAGSRILDGISLEADQGDVIALLGHSGSGKSTLLRCINFLTVPDEGDVFFRGERIAMQKTRHGERKVSSTQQLLNLRTHIAMVFQQFNLWQHKTILQNVTEAPIHVQKRPKAEAKELALSLLDKVGIADKKDNYPSVLSGGQQQRVAIARALAMQPDLILFDEPTSSLDPEMVGEVLGVMQSLAEEGTTMIVATHEMGFAREVANKVAFLADGKMVEQGSAAEIFASPKSPQLVQFLAAVLD